VALGGNAIAGERGADPASQQAAVEQACEQIAELVADGFDVVITHGNGPQVGNILLKNDLARNIVPAVPLDWCVAQTQATLGFLIVTALEEELARRGVAPKLIATVVTRVLIDASDPGWSQATKPIGRFVAEAEAREYMAHGESWQDRGPKGWRRVVPSPDPLEILDLPAIEALIRAGAVVVAAGGGGIPVVRADGRLRGVEAVLDKDLSGALLAGAVDADCYVMATDVEAAAVRFGTPEQEWLGRVGPDELRAAFERGEFAGGSMGPKVDAALRFVESGGARAVITSLEKLRAGVVGKAGTVLERVA
jgi:carbamate kinase